MDVALRLRRCREPGRGCMPAGRRAPRTPGATRCDSRPRRTRGTGDCRAAARPASGRTSAAASPAGAHDDEPVPVEENLAFAELLGELRGDEVPLVDVPARAVVQHALLPLLRFDPVVQRGIDYDELPRDSARLAEEARSLGLFEMTVEVTRHEPVKRAVFKRERQGVADEEL